VTDFDGAIDGSSTTHFGEVLGMRRVHAQAGATFEVEVGPRHLNRFGTVHGGVLMAMLDTAGLWAIAAPEQDPPRATTVSLNCNFVGQSDVGDRVIRVTARLDKAGRRTFFSSVVAESQPSGQLLATAQGVYSLLATG
jgi:uncharacterized protein (TIGR00369 family)